MENVVEQKQVSAAERIQINRQVKADLVEHLYHGCLPGTISGIVASIAIFMDYYGFTPLPELIAWCVSFNLMMLSLSGLFFVYLRYKNRFSLDTWEKAYSVMMIGCALSWTPIVYLLPNDMTRQYLALIALFLASTGYATGTIGQFRLCVATMLIMLTPLIVWSFLKGGIFYNIIGVYSLIYMTFMFGANLRSTQWFKESLKLKLENTLVSYQANHDILTDLPNQRLLSQYVNSAIVNVMATNEAFALISFSLNRMEMINDSLGHAAGDEVVQSVAKRLSNIATVMAETNDKTRCILTISRKDTFNILMVPIKPEEAQEKVKLLFSALEEPFYLQDRSVVLTASVGISLYPQDGEDAKSLLSNAEAAMLQAKQFGGNHMDLYRAEINAQLPKQLELESELYHALDKHQLQVYFQPLVDAKTHRIIGSEALIRWLHPVLGFISPAHFIPIAEQNGLIIPIGEWVLQQACAQTRMWQKMGYSDLKVAVNLSEKQMRTDEIITTVRRVLEVTEFDPRYLELEITETGILDEKVLPIIKEFTRMGLGIAVDDFGTGYSGLSYLKRFSIDKLKIDQSFIRDIPGNNDSITIVSAILAMAKELDVYSLAEGVETQEQLDFLTAKGCDYIQGYYFSKPLEASYFTRLLLSHEGIIDPIQVEKV